ncbi:hypothetical protein Megpolyxen_01404 [Candidatus Megaera polyxenophila]|nr:hypothetical protein Megpolyxen_01404 [Candidatus Megaera polyxenophila]
MKTTGYKESLEQYKDLVDKKGFADYLGDAFSKVGSGPAVGEAQRMSNAMLSGMGAGISGAAAEERKQKLSPMLEQAGRITAKAAELEAQMQESEQNRLMITNFIKQSAVPIAQLSQASLARDIPASNELAKGIYLNFKQGAGDPTMGDFDHYHNGVIYYHNLETGAIEGENVIGLMYQAGIDPKTIWGQDAPMIEAGLSPGAKKSYEDSEKMRQLEMQGKSADVALKQAHAGVYQQQANQIQNEMQAPKPKYSDRVMNKLIETNQNWVNSLDKEHQTLETQSNAYKQIAKIISTELKDKATRAGTSAVAQGLRLFNKANTESEKRQALIELYKQPLMAGIKQIFAGSTSNEDVALFMSGLPSLDKNPDAAIQVALERAEQIDNQLQKDNLTRDIVENEFGYSEPYNSLAVQNRVKERFKPVKLPDPRIQKPDTTKSGASNNSETISLFDPDTNKYYDVPAKEAEALHKKYPHLVRQ